MDLARDDSIREAFAAVLAEAQTLDGLINNAGAGVFGPTPAMPAELTREQFQLLVHGPMELIRLTVPHLRQRPRGFIINITSLAGAFPIPYMGAYNAAKAALSSYSRCLRLELAHTPIRIVDIQPADINTAFHSATRRVAAASGDADEERLAAVWEVQRRNMAMAPPPRGVAEVVWRVMNAPNPPPVVRIGGLFQAKIGPWIARFVPARLMDWFLRGYYQLGSRGRTP
jgi:short-subunit dehydrogenase